MAKITEPVNIVHHKYACIGNQTCLRQKNIKKMFAHTLNQCSKNAKYVEEVETATRREREEKAKADNVNGSRQASRKDAERKTL